MYKKREQYRTPIISESTAGLARDYPFSEICCSVDLRFVGSYFTFLDYIVDGTIRLFRTGKR